MGSMLLTCVRKTGKRILKMTPKRFQTSATFIHGLFVVKRLVNQDQRGYFQRLFCAQELSEIGWNKPVMQINQTKTAMTGSLRGMHMQMPPFSERKLVSCLQGSVFDVVVDMRKASPTFLFWHGEILSEHEANALLIPPGCAHGFQTLTDNVEMLYCHDQVFSPEHEFGVHPLDPKVNIQWHLPISVISDKDASRVFLINEFEGFEYAC